jgi:hypothetical protein
MSTPFQRPTEVHQEERKAGIHIAVGLKISLSAELASSSQQILALSAKSGLRH